MEYICIVYSNKKLLDNEATYILIRSIHVDVDKLKHFAIIVRKCIPEFWAAENDALDRQCSKSGIELLLRGTLRLGL